MNLGTNLEIMVFSDITLSQVEDLFACFILLNDDIYQNLWLQLQLKFRFPNIDLWNFKDTL